ncbi:MAG: TlpA disulfide reductase family protein [Bacteroidales bacterium]|nr:TlpA disulfide reductase family protein [Bacteroidales bacterium]
MNKLKSGKLIATVLIIFSGIVFSSFLNYPSTDKPKTGTEIGNMAPELKFAGVDGKILSLYSLKGKIVLVDFWASWCRPCRMENPSLVEAYNKYKGKKYKNAKGFEIFSVSLDQDKNAWIATIKSDGLVWQYHVSDLKGWYSEAARIYGVGSIPMNFLLNEKGIIIAKGLRGGALEYELSKLVK